MNGGVHDVAGDAAASTASNTAAATAAAAAAAAAAADAKGQPRPNSDVLANNYKSPEAEAIDRWFEDLNYYEKTLEQMAHAKLDENYREELKAIEQWFSVLSDPERTTALYSLLQHTTPVQIRFFITVLQQMAQKDPMGAPPGGASPIIGAGKPMMGPGKDDIISSANWSIAHNLSPSPNLKAYAPAAPGASPGSLEITRSFSSRSKSPHPVSPIFMSPSMRLGGGGSDAGKQRGAGAHAQHHPGDGWSHVQLARKQPPGSPNPGGYAHSEYSDGFDDYGADGTAEGVDMKGRAGSSGGGGGVGASKEKGKIPETVDLEALKDIPAWLRSLRLHKYTGVFEGCDWQEMVKMTDDDLIAKGVSALGARRKLLKVFELVRNESGIAA
ncbi:hypothetical protein DFJ73DRAFT_779759 [Zopfochytrium polystomum]|nr:hypothetical protein DFJ73DRAFT_779759 [Zopfochytrium polystomum]